MKDYIVLPPLIEQSIRRKQPCLWLNDHWVPLHEAQPALRLSASRLHAAEARLNRCAGVLMKLFPELVHSGGIIESALHSATALPAAIMGTGHTPGRWLIKCDHALPVAGSIKARGGFYEVLVHAENLAQRAGLMARDGDALALASDAARALFAHHRIAVGSTGNLGLSIGMMAAALGFQATVHMSADAKAWKKARLRCCGVEVVEHEGEYGAAVAAGRMQAQGSPHTYFVDDENSEHLFLGYSVAALRLARQLQASDVAVNAEHPLFVYLPCGVGGAPGGITFGLRHVFGDHVHCFFAEPVASPCMLVRLASLDDRPLSVQDVGLDNRTEADGLAVGRASEFAATMMKPLVSGVFTVRDDDLFSALYLLEQNEALRVEPSAVAGFWGPTWLLTSTAGQRYLAKHDLSRCVNSATHILWTTGGALVPEDEYRRFHARGRETWAASNATRLSDMGVLDY